MFKLIICLLSVLFWASTAYSQSARQQALPSEAEIGDLISKASEYVDTYKRTFTNTKASLDKAPTPRLLWKGDGGVRRRVPGYFRD
jgi:CHASE1-domain containing sensor protein